jgi:hypothetical protein
MPNKQQKQTDAQRAGALLLRGEIKTLEAVLLIIKPTPFATGIKVTPRKLNKMLKDHSLFSFGDIAATSKFLEVDEEIVHTLFWNEYKKNKKRR